MALPVKPYFFLSEVAARWGTTVGDLGTFAHEGLLELHVMAVTKRVAFGWYDGDGEDRVDIPGGTRILSGPQPVLRADLWLLIQNRVGTITRFRPPEPNGYEVLAEGVEPIKVTLSQLLVLREERDRFETEYDLKITPVAAFATDQGFEHNADYSGVSLRGRRFVLGPLQANIVRELHMASLSAEPWVKHEQLLEDCRSQSKRLVDVFKTQEHWRDLIIQDRKGSCRLNLPDRTPSPARQRAFRRAVMSNHREEQQ